MFCGNPPAISHGQLKFTGTSYNDWAHYTCDDGYSLNTHPVKRCTAKKRWSGLIPRCCKYDVLFNNDTGKLGERNSGVEPKT